MKYKVWSVIEKVGSGGKIPERVGQMMLTGEFDTQEDAEEYQVTAVVDCIYKYMNKRRDNE